MNSFLSVTLLKYYYATDITLIDSLRCLSLVMMIPRTQSEGCEVPETRISYHTAAASPTCSFSPTCATH